MKKLIILLLLSASLYSCKKNVEAYEKFDGTYDIKSTGNVNYFIGDTAFTEEPGLVVIKKGDNGDEIFMYVETNFVTSIAPLGVSVKAKVDGNEYTLAKQDLDITLDLGLGIPLSLPFSVTAKGTLSEDEKTLTSEITFSGGITGTMTSVGTKR